jgi:hypothetical protein
MLGVSAPDIADGHLEGTGAEPELRVHTTAEGWGAWMPVEFSADHTPDAASPESAAALPASEPIWVRSADGYEIRLPEAVERSGVTVHLVRDTGRPVARSAEPPTPPADPAVAARVAQARASQPPIRPRSSWGARAASRPLLRADNLRLAVVHHSVTTNSYSPAEVPGIIRGIQAFHMDANGWYDIAYNFVVDRFGVIWEGRGGGIANAVIGGHAKGFNTGSTGVVTLGEFTSVTPTSAMINAVGDLIGWKLFIHGADPDTTTVFTSYGNETYPEGTRLVMPRVVGHRDTAATACPGIQVEARLPIIRSRAKTVYDSLRGPGAFQSVTVSLTGGERAYPGDFDGDGVDDVLLYIPGPDLDAIAWGRTDGRFTVARVDVSGHYQPLVADFDGDYRTDIFWYGAETAYDKLWYGTAERKFLRVDVEVNGEYDPVVGDWNDDDAFDIIWYAVGNSDDRIWYGRYGQHSFVSHIVDITGMYTPVVGDFDGDAYDDVIWYGPGAARDRIWYGKPSRGLVSEPITVRRHYSPLVGDFTGDHIDDILWYGGGSGPDSMWAGRLDNSFATIGPVSIGGTYDPIIGDFNGGGYDDVLLYGSGGLPDRLWTSLGNGTFRTTVLDVSGVYEPEPLDLSPDGRTDVLLYGRFSNPDVVWLAAG